MTKRYGYRWNWRDLLRPYWKPDWLTVWFYISAFKWQIAFFLAALIVPMVMGGALAKAFAVAERWSVVRDTYIFIGAMVGFWLLWLRAKAAVDQSKSALRSNRTELLDSALTGLGAENAAQRVAAVRILADLAREDFDFYFGTVVDALSALVRASSADRETNRDRVRPEVQAAVQAIANLLEEFDAAIVFIGDKNRLHTGVNFSDAFLSYLQIGGGSLQDTIWDGAILEGAQFANIDLMGASFRNTNLERAFLQDNPKSERSLYVRCDFSHSNTSGAVFGGPLGEDSDYGLLRDKLIESYWMDNAPPKGPFNPLPSRSWEETKEPEL